MKIGIIVAMTAEFNLLYNLLEQQEEASFGPFKYVCGQFDDKEVMVMKSGIGKVCAAVGAVEMIKSFQPELIINSGIAGGIDVSSRVMDIVAGKEIVYHDVWCGEGNEYGQVQEFPARYVSDPKLVELVTSIDSDLNVYGGLICSGDQFITEKSELAKIKEKFPDGIAVDMESAALAQVCHLYQIPYLSLRIISDTPGIEDHAAQYANFWSLAPEKSLEVLQHLLRSL